ncbi:MAG: hypothetical protein ACKN9U_27250, partial [Pirellulaceae bacterium]
AALSTSMNLRPKKRWNHGMQWRGGDELFRKILVNSRCPLIPVDRLSRRGLRWFELQEKTFPPLVPRDPPNGRMRFVGDFAMGAREIGFLTLPQGGALRRNDESGRATSWF